MLIFVARCTGCREVQEIPPQDVALWPVNCMCGGFIVRDVNGLEIERGERGGAPEAVEAEDVEE